MVISVLTGFTILFLPITQVKYKSQLYYGHVCFTTIKNVAYGDEHTQTTLKDNQSRILKLPNDDSSYISPNITSTQKMDSLVYCDG